MNAIVRDRNEICLFESVIEMVPIETVVECLEATGSYDEDTDGPDITADEACSMLVDDVRTLGIELSVKRIPLELGIELCSLLQLEAANTGTKEETLKQIEEMMKRDSLQSFFQQLTPHMLIQICKCWGINHPSIHNNNNDNNNNSHGNLEKKQNTTTKLIVNSTPSIKIVDGAAIITTHTTKSSTQRFANGSRRDGFGEGMLEGSTRYNHIIKLLVEEVVLCGLEEVLYMQSHDTVMKLYKCLPIKDSLPKKFKDIVHKIIPGLFHLNQFGNINGNGTPKFDRFYPNNIVTPDLSNNKYLINNQNNNNNNDNSTQLQQNTIDNKKQYPQTPNDLSTSEQDSTSDFLDNDPISYSSQEVKENDNLNNNNNQGKNKRKYSPNRTGKLSFNNSSVDDNAKSNGNANKSEAILILSTDEEDNEIDSPAEVRPTLYDIKKGITKAKLERMLVKDLKQWLRSKRLKSNDKKAQLIERILNYMNGSMVTDESELEDTTTTTTTTTSTKKQKH